LRTVASAIITGEPEVCLVLLGGSRPGEDGIANDLKDFEPIIDRLLEESRSDQLVQARLCQARLFENEATWEGLTREGDRENCLQIARRKPAKNSSWKCRCISH